MSAPALAAGRPTVRIRGTAYPVLLPTLRDPRLHLAGVIVTLQVLGQTAFGFDLSIAQILVSLLTCAVLEVAIAFRRQRVLMWPASALLTGNGVAFVLRVPGTEHGDWWSMHGWWIYAGTAAIALLSKYVITFRGRHVFNPSNFGLVLCFLAPRARARRPAAFWWGPMSVWLAIALGLIVGGGLAILRRLRLVVIAAGFWLTFAAGIAVLAATGHEMTRGLAPRADRRPRPLVAPRHLAGDPRLPLLHDHRSADDPGDGVGRRVYAVSVGFLATLLLAPWTTRVRAQGRGAQCARDRLRRPTRSCSLARGPRRALVGTGAHCRRALAAARRAATAALVAVALLVAAGARPSRRCGRGAVEIGPRPTVVVDDVAGARRRRPRDRAQDRRRPRRRPRDRGGGAPHARPSAGERRRDRGVARRALGAGSSREGRPGRGDDLRAGPHPPHARARRRTGPAARGRDADRHEPDGDLRAVRGDPGARRATPRASSGRSKWSSTAAGSSSRRSAASPARPRRSPPRRRRSR